MALGDDRLNLISNMMDSARGNLNNYYEQIADCVERLNNNSNYQTFVSNTDIGSNLNEKLLQLRGIGDDSAGDIGRLLIVTDDFVDTQRELNRAQAAEVSYSSYDDSGSSSSTSTSSSSSSYAAKSEWYKNYYSGGSH